MAASSDFYRQGASLLRDAWARGEVGPREAWVAARGAAVFVDALARGDIRDGGAAGACAAACARCPSRRAYPTPAGEVGTCGERFKVGPHTCGCIVTLTTAGRELVPAGRSLVASLGCPQGRWPTS
jgi:hypothetical protein